VIHRQTDGQTTHTVTIAGGGSANDRLPIVSVAKVRLNDFCKAGDECTDVNAVCRNGVCICQLGYYDNGRDTCGMF